jgi:hypothetical protein
MLVTEKLVGRLQESNWCASSFKNIQNSKNKNGLAILINSKNHGNSS